MPKGDGQIKPGGKGPRQTFCVHCGGEHANPCPSPEEIELLTARMQAEWSPGVERFHRGLRQTEKEGVEIEEIAFEKIVGNRVYRGSPE